MPRRSDGGAGASRSALPSPRLMAWALVLLRVFAGVKFVLFGTQKWDWIGTPQLQRTLTQWAESAVAWEGYRRFLTQAVIPHAGLFTYLIVFGEIGVGILLLLGLLTRAAALLALVMNANYLLATWKLGPSSQWFNAAFLAMELALLIAGAGRVSGLDARLARKHPGWILW